MDAFASLLNASVAVLKDITAHEWKQRVAALKRIRDATADPKYDLRVGALRPIVPCLCRQVTDGRSAVVVEACQTIGALCDTLANEPGFDPYADAFVKCLLPLVVSSAGVVAESAENSLHRLVGGTSRGFQACFDRLIHGCSNGKAAATRRVCVQLVHKSLDTWDHEWLGRSGGNAAAVEVALRKSIRDADGDVRASARQAYWAFANVFPEDARRLLRELEANERQLIETAKKEVSLVPPSVLASSAEPLELVPVLKRSSSLAKTTRTESLRFDLPPSSTTSSSAPAPRGTHSMTAPIPALAPPTLRAAPTPMRGAPPKLYSHTPSSSFSSTQPLLAVTSASIQREAPRSAVKLSLRPSVNEQTPMVPRKTPQSKGLTPHHDRVAWALLGAGDPEPSRRLAAMQDLASFVVSSPSSPPDQLEDIVLAITSCATDDTPAVSASAFDTFGALVWAHGTPVQSALDKLLPLALKSAVAGERKVKVAADRAVQACVESIGITLLLPRVLAVAKAMAYPSDRVYANTVLAQLAPDASEVDFEAVLRQALEWKDEALGDALYEARPELVSRLVETLLSAEESLSAAPEQQQQSEAALEPVAAPPLQIISSNERGVVEQHVAELAKMLTEGNADQRKVAVDGLVKLRGQPQADAAMADKLNAAQLRLIDIFERKRRA